MIADFAERIFWVLGQVKIKEWQEPRLHHSKLLFGLHAQLNEKFNDLAAVYMSSNSTVVTIGEVLFKIENDASMNNVCKEIRDFMDEIKTEKEGWGGGMQATCDEVLKIVEIFSNQYNKE